ncbi:hypothetical protein [Microbacterium hominis]|uniref:DUF559 domain-containing protein n=1 Tax=Microbacterium hominis TaxID=162426 RepID=A0A7D4Q258_9MICO|nr:hypothetical protein [Microbacterium hominis]QKJ20378.1 hypothetical protein HQM25_14080 [Microbacterium hominis]
MPRPRPLPASLGTTFTVVEAAAAGVSAGRLRAADLDRPFRGVRIAPDPIVTTADEPTPTADEVARATTLRLAGAAAKVVSHRAFFGGRTAAVLHGLPVDPGSHLVVGVVRPHRPPRRPGVRGVKVSDSLVHVVEVEGLRVSSPASTWAMLATELTTRELVHVGDAIVRIPRDEHGRLQPESRLATPAQLKSAVQAGRRAGAARLRDALTLIRVGSASPLESDFRMDAAHAGLPHFELDVEILDGRGRRLGISEFAHRPTKTVVEVEGDHHRVSRKQWNRDIDKYADYAAAGWEVVRLTSAHIRSDAPRATTIVRDALLRRGWAPSP